ncbi:26S proteasome non-ATPase regulatory subunit 2 1A [Acorus gramineus]|uniref:26S proteasome non-ATPase regulatory subunit 2 1A n=1 Tax=Acorus gramineus TaxID=55184 RepID=A0AAV9ADI8_ACOGR|nr:26S proteasome non-ATPase regulatory subunit 2 1A [Acorus gramineus]
MAVDTNPNSTSPDPSKAPLKDQKKKKHAKKEEDLVSSIHSPLEEIRPSTGSILSIPKSLKYLKSHYPFLCAFFEKLTKDSDVQRNGWPIVDMMDLVNQIVAFQMKHNAEHEAVDILTEVESVDLLTEHVDETNYKRTCLYLTSYSRYTFPGVDDITALRTAYTIYLNFKDYTSSLRVALFFEDIQSVKRVFTNCEDLLQKKQFCYIIARHGMVLELDDEMAEEDEDREALQDIINNCKLSEGYLSVARDLEVMEPKSPEDIYKDKFMTVPSEFSSGSSSGDWIFKNKEHGKASAVSSLGMISLWDIDSGLAQIDKCLYSDDNQIVAGALLAVGIVTCGIKNEYEPALALLHGFTNKNDTTIRIGAIMGLGIAYAGSRKVEDYSKDTSDYLHIFNEKIRRFCDVILRSLAFAGTGDVDQIQVLQRYCAEDTVKNELHQGPAVLGIALVGMAEEVGIDMAIRALEHFLQYGGQNIRRAVPLALGLLCISNPKMNVRDTLSRLSHDSDGEVSMAAIISLGLIGAGTNNGRIAKMLRDLIRYYDGEAKHLFCPRMLLTVDENLKPIPVLVRVGKAVDVVAQAGRPRTVTSFQTFTTPVILGAGERAELATEKGPDGMTQ